MYQWMVRLGVMLMVGVGMVARADAQTCNPSSYDVYPVAGDHTAQMTTVVGLGNCPAAIAEAWLNIPFYCVCGSYDSSLDKCTRRDDAPTSHASTRARNGNVCGPVSGGGQGLLKQPQGNDIWQETYTASATWYVGCSDPPDVYCEYEWNPETEGWQCMSPIVVSVDGSEYTLTSVQNGVIFDLNGDGVAERVAWTRPGAGLAFLALDRNGNGIIDNGRELFGENTYHGARNGFDALARMNPGMAELTADSAMFQQLLLWTDRNHDGISQADELSRFADEFVSLFLAYSPVGRIDQFGNNFAYEGWAMRRGDTPPQSRSERKARRVSLFDVYMQTRRVD